MCDFILYRITFLNKLRSWYVKLPLYHGSVGYEFCKSVKKQNLTSETELATPLWLLDTGSTVLTSTAFRAYELRRMRVSTIL